MFCDTGIPRTFYGGKLCSVDYQTFLLSILKKLVPVKQAGSNKRLILQNSAKSRLKIDYHWHSGIFLLCSCTSMHKWRDINCANRGIVFYLLQLCCCYILRAPYFSSSYQRYTYRVLQTIQMKLKLLCRAGRFGQC